MELKCSKVEFSYSRMRWHQLVPCLLATIKGSVPGSPRSSDGTSNNLEQFAALDGAISGGSVYGHVGDKFLKCAKQWALVKTAHEMSILGSYSI